MPMQGLSASNDLDTIAYHVKPGDTVTRIIEKYHGTLPHAKQQAVIKQIKQKTACATRI